MFGKAYNKATYDETIRICELSRDLEILPAGDQTEIGEKGINLSGGQKARVSLARAVYADREVVVMDDPISALDANVKKNIFKHVFTGKLKNKTRVLVTHAVDFLHLVDRIILLQGGEVQLSGSYDELKDDPYMVEIIKLHKAHQEELDREAMLKQAEADQEDEANRQLASIRKEQALRRVGNKGLTGSAGSAGSEDAPGL